MSIYTSERVLPYVYMCTHRITGEFYIGSRTTAKQNLPSHLDLPKYKTSSKKVKPRFDEFDWVIVAEFFDAASAYAYEQLCIFDTIHNFLSLNNCCFSPNTYHMITKHRRSPQHLAAMKAGREAARIAGRTWSNKDWVTGRKMSDATLSKRTNTRREKAPVRWLVISPSGETIHTSNLKETCKIHQLDPSTMRRVADGIFAQHKGWMCKRIHP